MAKAARARREALFPPLLLLLLGAHLALSLAFMLGSPSFEKPDEPGHFDYVRFISLNHRLPGPLPKYPYVESAYEGQQPPLYYAIQAVLLRALDREMLKVFDTDPYNRYGIAASYRASPREAAKRLPRPNVRSDAFGGPEVNMFLRDKRDSFPYRYPYNVLRTLRLTGIFFGLLTVFIAYRLGVLLFGPGSPWALLGAALVGFNPQFCFISGSINNDPLLIFLAAYATYLAMRFVMAKKPDRSAATAALLGIILGLAALTKINSFALIPFVLACLLLGTGLNLRRSAVAIGACLLAAGAVAGWYFMRNLFLFGDFLGLETLKAAHAAMVSERSLFSPYFLPLGAFSFPLVAFESFWAGFGWLNIRVHPGIILVFLVLSAAGLTGALALILAAPRRSLIRTTVPLLFLHAALSLAFMINLNLTFMQPQGRYLFGSILPIAMLLALGLRFWVERTVPHSSPFRKAKPYLITGTLLLLAFLSLLNMLNSYAL